MALYAIARGLNTGIFKTSEEFNKYKVGKYSCGKKFKTEKDAKKYINDINNALSKDKYAFIDLEFTCSKKIKDFKHPNHIGEVLSIGIVITDVYGNIIDTFYRTVKPKYNYEMSEFCKKLTHLEQSDINDSANLVNVINTAYNFISKYNIDAIYCFGTSDYLQTKRDIESYKGHALYPKSVKFVNKFKNCQKQIVHRIIGQSCEISLNDCKKILNIEGDVTHNALSDAKDLSKIYFGSIYNPPSNSKIKKYKEEREKRIRYKQLRNFNEDDSLDFTEKEKNKIKDVCKILEKNNENVNSLKIQALIDDLLELSKNNINV